MLSDFKDRYPYSEFMDHRVDHECFGVLFANHDYYTIHGLMIDYHYLLNKKKKTNDKFMVEEAFEILSNFKTISDKYYNFYLSVSKSLDVYMFTHLQTEELRNNFLIELEKDIEYNIPKEINRKSPQFSSIDFKMTLYIRGCFLYLAKTLYENLK